MSCPSSTSSLLLRYDSNLNVVTAKKEIQSTLTPKDMLVLSSKVYLIGDTSSTVASVISGDFENLQFLSDFSTTTSIGYTKLSSGDTTYQINDGTIPSLTATNSHSMVDQGLPTISDFTNLDFTPGIQYSARIIYNLETETFNLIENSNGKLYPTLSEACDSSVVGLTLTSNAGETMPSWISFNSTTKEIEYSAPSTTSFTFTAVIETTTPTWTSARQKILYFNVGKCQVEHCRSCYSTDFTRCKT